MVRLAPELKRGFLNSLARQAKTNDTPIFEALGAFQDGGFDAVKTGRLVVSHTGAGKSVTFQFARIGQQLTQEEVFAFSQELLEIYADALIALNITPDEGDNSQDENILPVMMADARLDDIDVIFRDYTTLTLPWR